MPKGEPFSEDPDARLNSGTITRLLERTNVGDISISAIVKDCDALDLRIQGLV